MAADHPDRGSRGILPEEEKIVHDVKNWKLNISGFFCDRKIILQNIHANVLFYSRFLHIVLTII